MTFIGFLISLVITQSTVMCVIEDSYVQVVHPLILNLPSVLCLCKDVSLMLHYYSVSLNIQTAMADVCGMLDLCCNWTTWVQVRRVFNLSCCIRSSFGMGVCVCVCGCVCVCVRGHMFHQAVSLSTDKFCHVEKQFFQWSAPVNCLTFMTEQDTVLGIGYHQVTNMM